MAYEKKINTKTVYKGYIINVTLDDIEIEINNDIIKAKREIVHHNGGVCGLVKLKNGKIPFVVQYRYAFSKEMIELPAGKLNENEDPMHAIIREIEEEIGIIPTSIIDKGYIYVSPGISDEVLHLYYIDDYVQSNQHFDEDEFLELKYFDYDEAEKLICDNTINDSKTICLMHKCYKYFKED